MIDKNICPKCKKGTLVFGTFDLYCSENCGHREPHKHGDGPYTCTCGPKIMDTARIAVFPDKLDELFKLQKGINDFIIKTKGLSELPHLDKWATAIMHEGGELWSASTDGKGDGKWWKENPDTREHQIEELVDILHFFLGACLSLNLTPQELFDAYHNKLGVNYKRQKDGY